MSFKIATKNGNYKYKPVKLFNGRKVIDIKVTTKNLLDFKKLLNTNSVKFGIIFGTLLGAIREKNFIIYDEDVDVFMLYEDRELFLSLLFEFREIGFEVARDEDSILSLIRKDDYIDIYFFKKYFFRKRICRNWVFKDYFLEKLNSIDFLGEKFNIPNKPIKLLEMVYGKDWNTPKKGCSAKGTCWWKNILKALLPKVLISYLVKLKNLKK